MALLDHARVLDVLAPQRYCPNGLATVNAQQQAAKGREMKELILVQKIAGWEKLKSWVFDSVSSPIAKRV